MAFAWYGWVFLLLLAYGLERWFDEKREADAVRRIEEAAMFRKYRILSEKGRCHELQSVRSIDLKGGKF